MGKLSEKQVNEIRNAPIGTKLSALARKYGVSVPTISRHRSGDIGKRTPETIEADAEPSRTVPRGRNMLETLANSVDGQVEAIRRTTERILGLKNPETAAKILFGVARATQEVTSSLANLKHPSMLSWLTKDELADLSEQVFTNRKTKKKEAN